MKTRSIKERHTSTKVSWRVRTKCIPKVKESWSSSVTSANAMPTSVFDSRVKESWSSSVTSANAMPTSVFDSRAVLIARLICHDEINSLRGNDTLFKYKSELHFPSQNKRTCTTLT